MNNTRTLGWQYVEFLRGGAMPVRVMVVDGYQLVRDALRMAIRPMPALELVADAGGAEEAMALAMAEEPDVILLDVAWPSLDGLAAALPLREALPEARIVMYSSQPEFETTSAGFEPADTAIAAGADAYVSAGSTLEEVLAVLRTAPELKPRD